MDLTPHLHCFSGHCIFRMAVSRRTFAPLNISKTLYTRKRNARFSIIVLTLCRLLSVFLLIFEAANYSLRFIRPPTHLLSVCGPVSCSFVLCFSLCLLFSTVCSPLKDRCHPCRVSIALPFFTVRSFILPFRTIRVFAMRTIYSSIMLLRLPRPQLATTYFLRLCQRRAWEL